MDKRLERQLEEVLRQPGNDTCADCHAPAPRWASVNLGIFLCVGCASVHRKLGTHKSRVKSVTLDTWTRDQISHVKSIGNNAANAVWNPNETLHPPPTSSIHDERDSEIERYIRKKYELGAFRVKPSSSSGGGGGRMVEPTSLNRARERDGRLPASTGTSNSSGLGRENNKNPELNDIIARREFLTTKERDLPPLPSSGMGPSAPPRPRPTRSPSNNNANLNSTTSIWNTSSSSSSTPSTSTARNTTTPAFRTGMREANLVDFSDTSANNATLPLQVNMSAQNQNGRGASPASYGGMAGSWSTGGTGNQAGPSSMSTSQGQGQFLSPQLQPGSWNNTQNGFSSSPSFANSPFNQNMQNSYGASPQHQQQQQFGTSPTPNMNMGMFPSPSPQQTYQSVTPQSVYGQHLSPQPTFAAGGQMSPQTQPSPMFNNQPRAFPQQQPQQMFMGYGQNQSQPIMQGQGQGYAGTYGYQHWHG